MSNHYAKILLNIFKREVIFLPSFLPSFLAFFFFLGLYLQHMEVPRLGLNQSCSCQPTPQQWQPWILATIATYPMADGNARP